MVRRIYVEKKKGFDVEAEALFNDVKENLHIDGLSGVRILNRYDMDGIDDATYEAAKYTVFAEPAIDIVYEETMPEDAGSAVFFAVEYLPGQYDQRADSAAQCIKLMNTEAEAVVKFARTIVLEGDIDGKDLEAIKKYCVNPVDSQIAAMEKPDDLAMETVPPEDVPVIDGFRTMTESALEGYRKEMGFAMSTADIAFVQQYYRDEERRDPTLTELKVIDTYWSDHCRHTTFNTTLRDVGFDDSPYGRLVAQAFAQYLDMRKEVYGAKEKNLCLMDMACIGAKYLKKYGKVNNLDESEEINACSIKVKARIDGKEEDWLVMFKNETHNHPTEIEPFGGAATCLGGAIRDPLSGRVYVYQAMRVTGAADPRRPIEETINGKLPQRKITREAAQGYSSYGNQIGLATGLVDEVYHENYVAKRMEIGAVVGAAPADHVIRKTPQKGDIIVLVGGRTGRDGCGGATGSSKEHTEESILQCGAEVQKGNPPVERNIQRLFRRKEVANLIKRCNDFGAGGVSVAIGELADGLDINLDLVPKKYEGLDGTELAISESQERMAVVIDADRAEEFIGYADEENLEATIVATVTDTNRVRMYWREKCILDISRDFLNTNGAQQFAKAFAADPKFVAQSSGDLSDILKENRTREQLLTDLNCCSKKGLTEMFDSTIGAATVLMPLGGRYQLSPAAGMAAKLPVTRGETDTATIMSYGFDPELAMRSPFHGALYAVVDSVTKIAAMGGDYRNIRLTFQEYFEKLGEEPQRWGKPMAALLGALRVQKELEIPAIGGKDSMSGTFMDIDVPPTLASFAITTIDAGEVLSTEFKYAGSHLVAVTAPIDKDGVIDFDIYRNNLLKIRELAARGKILAADAIGRGGLYMTLVRMAVGNRIGVDVKVEGDILSPMFGSLVIEIPAGERIDRLMSGSVYTVLGSTTADRNITVNGKSEDIKELTKRWQEPLEGVFPVRTPDFRDSSDDTPVEQPVYIQRNTSGPAVRIAKPRVVIPAFPGTNCEMDSARAFRKAGAEADIHIIRNQTTAQLEESIRQLEQKIRSSQIIMIPGGFSGGDEPDGSAKFITAVFRNPGISDAVSDLLENRDGLMLGICNGFQALIKLGLVPEGKIVDGTENSPTLTYNKIGRHASCLVRTGITSVKSPWLAGVNVGDVFTIPVSHGEGRFIASGDVLEKLKANGQIATQYVDFDGNPSMDIAFNPNGSVMAIEGITSPDGRVLGKMGHSERIGHNVYKNVLGDKDQKIFESGVKYFK
ncbi:MAG TPA: phosphoribosylformylglycinamidine synthase [Candidatus Copromorpha excrementipullorum]|uniref:Phosphoribosylformylglycinamidine synthase n=1 Tax=Candidatus Allocopromorpha excrementipullorum TaxID=2840743 RepID=A0A9D1N810_9FIRM|nr:phosphoribosylformylglycinamidine synthase [Candidatus Copromorpha excrementipullorum]